MSEGPSRTALLVAAALLVALALLLPTIALIGRFDSNPTPRQEETVLRMGFMSQVDSLNPLLGSTEASRFYYGLVYDCLQTVDQDLEYAPNLATDWEMVPDTDPSLIATGEPYGSVWDYHITQFATWHDGHPFTAEDVVWNLNLNCFEDNYTTSWAYWPEVHFMKFAEKIDNDTVRVHFFDRLTGEAVPVSYADFVPIFMLPRHLLENQSASYTSFQWPGYFNGTSTPVIGTGPFLASADIVSEFGVGGHLTLLRNPSYHWKAEKGMEVKVDKLIMYFFDDFTAMKIALDQHMLDIAKFPPSAFRALENDTLSGRLKFASAVSSQGPSQYWTSIQFNMNLGGGNQWRLDPAARRSLAMAVDKAQIVREFYEDLASEGSGIISPVASYWHWDPGPGERLDYNLTQAAAALEAGGYVDSDGDSIRECNDTCAAVINGWAAEGDELGLKMRVRLEFPEEKEIAEYLEGQWADIGVNMSYEVFPERVIAMPCYSCPPPDAIIMGMSSGTDPNRLLFWNSNRSWTGTFGSGYENPRYEENYSKSVQELNLVSRRTLVFNCQEICYQDAPQIVLAYVNSSYVWRTSTFYGWGNWTEHPGLCPGMTGTSNYLLFNLEPPSYGRNNDSSGWLFALGVASAGAAVPVIIYVLKNRKV